MATGEVMLEPSAGEQIVTDGEAGLSWQEGVAWAKKENAKTNRRRRLALNGMGTQGFGRNRHHINLFGGRNCERQVKNPELPNLGTKNLAHRTPKLYVSRLVLLVRALEVLDLLAFEVPYPGGDFVDQVVIVSNQQHRPLVTL
jgi:hypothetical protein